MPNDIHISVVEHCPLVDVLTAWAAYVLRFFMTVGVRPPASLPYVAWGMAPVLTSLPALALVLRTLGTLCALTALGWYPYQYQKEVPGGTSTYEGPTK